MPKIAAFLARLLPIFISAIACLGYAIFCSISLFPFEFTAWTTPGVFLACLFFMAKLGAKRSGNPDQKYLRACAGIVSFFYIFIALFVPGATVYFFIFFTQGPLPWPTAIGIVYCCAIFFIALKASKSLSGRLPKANDRPQDD